MSRDSEPAFPVSNNPHRMGMSLHDYYVGQAIMGFATRGAYADNPVLMVRAARELADAVILARKVA